MKRYADSTLMECTKVELIQMIRNLELTCDGLHEMNDRQFRLLMEKEIYAWHDLRKNPDDLPKDGDMVFCQHLPKLITDKKKLIVQHQFIDGRFVYNWDIDTDISSSTFGQRYYGDIIAWREIEPFEEVEE